MPKKQIPKSKKDDPVRGREGLERASASNGANVDTELRRLKLLIEINLEKSKNALKLLGIEDLPIRCRVPML